MRNTKDISGGEEQAIDPAIQDEFAAMIAGWQADADNGYGEWLDDCDRNDAAAIEDEREGQTRIVPVGCQFRADVRYPGCDIWQYVGLYHNEHLAIERAGEQLQAWGELAAMR